METRRGAIREEKVKLV